MNENVDGFNEQGLQHLQTGDPSSALTAFSAAVAADPTYGQAWYGKGCAHSELEEFEEAIQAYEQSAEHAGDRASLPLFNLGNLYQQLGQMKQAAQCFLAATESDPAMGDAWINLGRILDDAGSHDSAIECYDTALQLEPEDPMALSNRGNSLRSLDRFDEAMESYQKSLSLDEMDFAAIIGSGVCMVQCGNVDNGLATLQSAMESTQHPIAMFEFATALAGVDQYLKAAEIYTILIESGFESPEVWNNQAECQWRLDRFDDAISSFDKSIALDEEFAPAWFGKARALTNSGRVDEASPVVRRYLKLASDEEKSSPAVRALAEACGLGD